MLVILRRAHVTFVVWNYWRLKTIDRCSVPLENAVAGVPGEHKVVLRFNGNHHLLEDRSRMRLGHHVGKIGRVRLTEQLFSIVQLGIVYKPASICTFIIDLEERFADLLRAERRFVHVQPAQ